MYKLIFFVPEANKEQVKERLFQVGAGKLGNYCDCCFETLGRGQFKPLSGARPAIGEVGQLEFVQEYKVELIVENDLIAEVVAQLKQCHPYETPAYEIYKLEDF